MNLVSATTGLLFQGVSYGVFGLGNKQYEHFCAVGHKVHAAMQQLGAAPVVRRGDGDDDVDIDADFESWRTELYVSLDKSALIQQKEVIALRHASKRTVSIIQLPLFTDSVLRLTHASASS